MDTLLKLKNLTVAYIEDDVETNLLTSEFLRDYFKNLYSYYNFEDFESNMDFEEIDILITDISLPTISGLDIIKKVKEVNPNLFSIVISAHTDSDTLIKAIEKQVNGYLVKPFNVKKLESLLIKYVDENYYLESSNSVVLDFLYSKNDLIDF